MAAPFNRRAFLKTSGAALAGAAFVPYLRTSRAGEAGTPASKNDRVRFAAIGLRYQGSVIAKEALAYGDLVALCDVDAQVLAKARQELSPKADTFEDYRKVLERKDVEAVLIGTPDHWHAHMIIDACRAGKDVYSEKPLTLTVDEGHHVQKVVKETGRVVQVGSWQRSDSRFRLAAEMVHAGRLGKIEKITVALGKNVQGGPFEITKPPADFNWNLWQGQTPDVPYIKERSHYTFRWWYEYSGGQMTDWGAHHVDIAQWILGQNLSGPVKVEAQGDFPNVANGYNVPKTFSAKLTYATGAVVEVLDEGRNGLLVDGADGQLFVNRGSLQGSPVEALADMPLARDKFQLYAHDNRERPERAGKIDAIKNHMGNFFDCLSTRKAPISDVASQHRSICACHLANLSLRLKRPLRWDPVKEQVEGDEEANRWLSRPQRKGFEFSA